MTGAQTPQERCELVSREVFQACRNMAPHGWISDYVECVGEVPYTDNEGNPLQIQSFPEYLREQLGFQEEDDGVNPPEYYESIQGYLDEFHADYCRYCHTFGHTAETCPDTPMQEVTLRVTLPAHVSVLDFIEAIVHLDGVEAAFIPREGDDDAS